jgi:hypothetical protein
MHAVKMLKAGWHPRLPVDQESPDSFASPRRDMFISPCAHTNVKNDFGAPVFRDVRNPELPQRLCGCSMAAEAAPFGCGDRRWP